MNSTNSVSSAVSLSDWLSMIAIIVSLLALVLTVYLENRRLKRESDAKFFQDIYYSYMKSKIPIAEAKIRFDKNENKIYGTDDILSVLKNLRKKSSPYRFLDEEFYKKFTKFLEDTEDFYSEKQNNVRDYQKYRSFQEESTEKLTELYNLLNQKFQNKKYKKFFRK